MCGGGGTPREAAGRHAALSCGRRGLPVEPLDRLQVSIRSRAAAATAEQQPPAAAAARQGPAGRRRSAAAAIAGSVLNLPHKVQVATQKSCRAARGCSAGNHLGSGSFLALSGRREALQALVAGWCWWVMRRKATCLPHCRHRPLPLPPPQRKARRRHGAAPSSLLSCGAAAVHSCGGVRQAGRAGPVR